MFFRDLEKFQLCGPREVNFSLNSLRSCKLYLEYVCHLLIILGLFHWMWYSPARQCECGQCRGSMLNISCLDSFVLTALLSKYSTISRISDSKVVDFFCRFVLWVLPSSRTHFTVWQSENTSRDDIIKWANCFRYHDKHCLVFHVLIVNEM